jgi:hypothetical protein
MISARLQKYTAWVCAKQALPAEEIIKWMPTSIIFNLLVEKENVPNVRKGTDFL